MFIQNRKKYENIEPCAGTIITAFPRRWGRNKPDPSGVHKAIRDRLEDLQDGDIRSIYDLASIIIDQSSQVFFDRTKPIDERPEVLDIFANAIANVVRSCTLQINQEAFY